MAQKLSLKWASTLFAVFAVLMPTLILSGWYGANLFQQKVREALELERHANNILQVKIDSEIQRFKTLLINKSDPLSSLIYNPETTNNPETLSKIYQLLASALQRETTIHELMVLSPQAEVIATIDPAMGITGSRLLSPKELEAVAIRASFNSQYDIPEVIIPLSGRIYVGSPVTHDDTTVFNIAVPIGSPAKAILVALIDIEKLWRSQHDNIEQARNLQNVQEYVLDRRGALLTDINHTEHASGDLMTHMSITRSALIGEQWPTNTPYLGVRGQQVYGTLTAIPSLNWSLISEIPTAAIVTPIVKSLFETFAYTLLCMVIVIWLILRLVNKLINPIQRASTAIASVASGDFQLELQSSGIRELDTMNHGITQMAAARQRAEQSLKEREQDLAITLNSIGDAVITTDANGNVTRMNPVAEQITGWTLQEARGLTIKTIVPIVNARTRESIDNPVDKVISTGETIYLSNDTTLITRDGQEYQIADSAAPIINNGVITGMVLIFNDVTEQYKMREMLRSKEQEQREILNSMLDSVLTIDGKGVVLTFNNAAEKLFGYCASEIIGTNARCLLTESYAELFDKALQQNRMIEQSHVIGGPGALEIKGLHKNQESFPMRALITELPKEGREDGRPRFVCSFLDLTVSKQQEEQIRRTQKMGALGTLTGGIAHDYNNMLGIILGFSGLLKDNLKDQEKLLSFAEEIHRAGERGANLTKKLLSFSRNRIHDAGKVNINSLLLQEQDMLQKTLTVAINLIFDLETDLWPVYLDSNELEDAILNMSINAMHAMANSTSESTLTIRTRNQTLNTIDAQELSLKPDDYVKLSITDTGMGMDKNIMDNIFDPFFSTKEEKGTGLGLSQVYGLVDSAGGTIKVHSIPGNGSEFALYFPRHIEEAMSSSPISTENNSSARGNETILIVDDEPALRELSTELLSSQGYKILSADNGERALQILEVESVDLMLSDVIMPKMDGYQLAGIVQEKYPNIKIQLASGFTSQHNTAFADGDLQKNLLHKPFNARGLLKKIRSLLDSN